MVRWEDWLCLGFRDLGLLGEIIALEVWCKSCPGCFGKREWPLISEPCLIALVLLVVWSTESSSKCDWVYANIHLNTSSRWPSGMFFHLLAIISLWQAINCCFPVASWYCLCVLSPPVQLVYLLRTQWYFPAPFLSNLMNCSCKWLFLQYSSDVNFLCWRTLLCIFQWNRISFLFVCWWCNSTPE